MNKVDPRLKFLQSQREKSRLLAIEATGRFGLTVKHVTSPRVRVLVQYSGDTADLEKAGMEITSTSGDVVAGSIGIQRINSLAEMTKVSRIESSRPLSRELDTSVPEIRADLVHAGPPGHHGSGVIVGIIDTGVDWQHPNFRRQDGTSRILYIWDQSLTHQGTENRPAPFGYGVEYTRTDIDTALTSPNPEQLVRHRDSDPETGHGTHVTGIAAGDGSAAGNDQPAFTFVGVAPESDIIVVANMVTTESLGDSASTLDAISYIFNQAAALNCPVMINMSQGDNLGPHDGTSLLERGIDNLVGGQGRAFVKSAGNEGRSDRHASGTVSAGETVQVRINVPSLDTSPDTIDIWYAGIDRIDVSVTPPRDTPSAVVNPGNTQTLDFPNGNRAFVDSVLNDPTNNDNRIYIQLEPGTEEAIQRGKWTINLTGALVTNGQFHAWIERGQLVPQFLPPHVNNTVTISIPGTARGVITAASYITNGTGAGSISSFSSRGPTRDGRDAPTIAAPGQSIMSARAQGISEGSDHYHLLAGTSMASPHVVGVIALMLEANPHLTQHQIRDILVQSARMDEFTGTTPNPAWGGGKIDAKAAFVCPPSG